MKIAYKITAVREREKYVDRLVSRMSNPEVLWDEEKRGCIWNTMRAWGGYKDLPQDVTHLCVMSDDADIVNGYEELVQLCVDNFPDAIWTFYSNELALKHKPKTTPYIRLDSYNIRGIAFLLPVGWIPGYIEFYDQHLRKYDYPRDDATCRIYACMNRLPTMTTIPNLVRSEEIPSAMRYHGVTHNSDCWQGYDIDFRQFKQHEAEHRMVTAKSAIETHLPKDNPVDIMVRREYSRQMKTIKELRK